MNPKDYIADHVQNLPRSRIRDFAIVSEMPQAISLGIGEPDFVTPWKIREASIFALERKTSYTDNRGLLFLRKEISSYVSDFFGPEYDPQSERFLVTVGVSEAIDIALRAILNPGEKVLYHRPCYVSYAPSVSLAHGETIPVELSHSISLSRWNPKPLKSLATSGCQILLLNFPTNQQVGPLIELNLRDLLNSQWRKI